MTVGTGEAFRRRVAGQVDRERREAEIRGVHPIDLKPNHCVRCGYRLVVKRGPGNRVISVTHEGTKLMRCSPPAAQVCGVCEAQALVQCSAGGCEVMAHPKCLHACACCDALICIDHARSDGMCEACGLMKEASQ